MVEEPDDEELEDDGEENAQYPPEVETLHAALRRLVAVEEVTTGLKRLADYEPKTYSFPGEFGDLPHALLRRTAGGLADEMWAHTEFELTRDEAGWLTLEFLAWWARDLARGGEQVELRPMALPPRADEVQLGRTLKFILDHFIPCPGGDPAPALAAMQDRGESLARSIDLYADVLGPLVHDAEEA